MVESAKTPQPRNRRPPATRVPRTAVPERTPQVAPAAAAQPVAVTVRAAPERGRDGWEIPVPVIRVRRVHLPAPHRPPVNLAQPRGATILLASGARVAAGLAFWPVAATIDAGVRIARRAKRGRSTARSGGAR
jgi:hypothetical protein